MSEIIDIVEPYITGPQGPGGTIESATAVGLAPGAEPTVTLGGTPEQRTIEFGIPEGEQGTPATITSATAETLPPQSDATVTVGGTPSARTFAFGIPKGDPGSGSVNSVNGDLGPDVELGPTDIGGSTAQTAGTMPIRGNGGVLPGIGMPAGPNDAANKAYVDDSVDGLSGLITDISIPDERIAASFDIDALGGPVGQRLNIPTHISPSGGQVTHPSVVYFTEPWNGFRYWMAVTPYPGGNDAHEDPNIVASLDGITWVVPPGLTNPLDDAPGSPQYNSDTELVYAQGKLWCFWRYLDTGGGNQSENIFVRSSEDGITWGPKSLVHQSNQTTQRLVSPTLMFSEGVWTMWAVDIVNPSANKLVRMISAGDSPLVGEWGAPVVCSVSLPSGRVPWHVQIRPFGGRLYGILNDCVSGQSGTDGNLFMIESADGLAWERGEAGLIPKAQAGEHTFLYRATFVPEFNDGTLGFRVWYSAWRSSPSTVWNVYRTFVFVGKPATQDLQHGTFNTPELSFAVGNGHTQTRNFPRAFETVPDVSMMSNAGRLNIAILDVTRTNFTYRLENWSGGATNKVVVMCQWIAVAG